MNEQVCLMRLFREIVLPSLGLIPHVHDVFMTYCITNAVQTSTIHIYDTPSAQI